MTHVTCRLTAENRDQLRNPTLGRPNRVRVTFTFYLDFGCFFERLVETLWTLHWAMHPLSSDYVFRRASYKPLDVVQRVGRVPSGTQIWSILTSLVSVRLVLET